MTRAHYPEALADDPELTVTYSVDPPGMAGETMRLPQVSRRMTRDEVLIARGTADAFALRWLAVSVVVFLAGFGMRKASGADNVTA